MHGPSLARSALVGLGVLSPLALLAAPAVAQPAEAPATEAPSATPAPIAAPAPTPVAAPAPAPQAAPAPVAAPKAVAAPVAPAPAPKTGFSERLVLDDGRTPVAEAEAGVYRVLVHGELQLRGTAQSDLPLEPSKSGVEGTSLGQSKYLYQWFRVTPRVQFGDWLEVVGQMDVPRGMSVGDVTHGVGAADVPLDERMPFGVEPRWLYAEAHTPIGNLKAGQQGSHWGMGLVANDGDHASLFGDYRRGDLSERVLFATKPLGKESPFAVAVAGDLVFRDDQAKLVDGDHAYQGVLVLQYEKDAHQAGLYGVRRHQTRDRATREGVPYADGLDVTVIDVAGKTAYPLAGFGGYVFGQFEAAYIRGDTTLLRSIDQLQSGEKEQIRSWGGAAQVGVVREKGEGDARFGSLMAALEWGWATGDADPNDGTSKRFTFDRNHNVGLVMFQALGWKTARAAVIAQDPSLSARAAHGLELLPSNGGVFGATYVNPTVIVRPMKSLDLKAGIVLARTTADVVDPYRLNSFGRIANWDGGDAKRHDLGVEIDLGTEWRAALDYGLTLQLGAQGGYLIPGHAFDDASGAAMPAQYVAVGRVGLQY